MEVDWCLQQVPELGVPHRLAAALADVLAAIPVGVAIAETKTGRQLQLMRAKADNRKFAAFYRRTRRRRRRRN